MNQRVHPLDKNLEPDQSEEWLVIQSFDDRDPQHQGKTDIQLKPEQTEWLDDFQSKKFKEEDDNNEQKTQGIYSNILLLRRMSRVCLLGVGLFIIIIIFVIGHIVSMSSGTWESSVAKNLVIRQGNCLVNIHNHDQQNIKVEYTQKGSMISAIYQKDYGMSGFNSFSDNQGTVELAFINYIQNDIKDCIVSLYLPMLMQSLDFRCMDNTQCHFVSHDTLIAAGINFTSESHSSLYVNSKTIQTDTLNYNSTKGGALYLNHLISANVNIYSFTGPILIQSTADFEVTFTSNSSSYCSSSIYIDGTSTNCDNTSNTICSGTIKQCQSSNCNPNLQKYSISTIYGTIYSNLIQQIGQFSENVEIYKSMSFGSEIEFDTVSKQEINRIKQEAFLEADLIVKISVGGNLLLQHSQNTFWVYFSNSAYAAFQPWWLSFFSATFLTAQTFDVDLQVNNYFCPHTQVITIEQAYQLSNLIFKQFNQNVGSEGVSYINKQDKPLPSYHPDFNLTGIEELHIKSFFTSESWYNMKLNQQLIEWYTLAYEPTFIVIIVLSLLSAIILALIIRTLLVAFLMELESQTITQVEEMQNYNDSQLNQKTKKNSDLATVMKKALQRIGDSVQVKYFFSLVSYQIYLYQRQYKCSSQQLFFKSLFRYQPKKNNEGKQRLNDKQLKEMYDKFCYLSHCPTEPLKDEINLLQQYGFDLKENAGNLGLAKIRLKNKILISNYSKLSNLEKQGNPVDYFFQTQFDFTGIQSDQIDSIDINHYFQQFMDEGAKFQVINLIDAAEKYNLTLVNLTNQELVKNTSSTNYIINPHFNVVLEIISDPLKIIKSDIGDSVKYTQFYTFSETIKYNRSTLQHPYTHSDIMDDRDAFINILDVIYPNGWLFADIIITLNFYFLIFLQLLPTLFFLILISTSYAPYSLNHPKSLLFAEDMLLRPWSLYIYVIYIDPVLTYFIIIFIFYFIISIYLEMNKNTVIQYPEDMGFLNQIKNSDSVVIESILNLQWGLFISGITLGLIYICLVMEWLLLGAIINPNNFLVYASSVATLIATILQQISQAKQTYEFGKKIVLEYINKNYLSKVTLIASSLMQESLMLSNQIQLPSLGEAFAYAEKAGFGTELRDLCTKDINFFEQDQPGANSIEKMRQDYQRLKDNLFEKIVNKFSQELQQTFKMDKNLSEVLASINFKRFEDVEDNLAEAIEKVTREAIPGFLIKWVLKSTKLLMNVEQHQKIPIFQLLLELVGKNLMRDLVNPKLEQILSITIQYIYEFEFNGDISNREQLLEQLYHEIKLFTNEDLKNKDDILLLKYFMEYFLILMKKPKDAQNRMNEIINNISSLMDIKEEIKFILSFLFSSENDSTFRLGDKTISEQKIIEEYLISFIDKNQLDKQEIVKISFLIKIAVRFLKMNRLQLDLIFIDDPIASDKEKQYYYSTFLSNILQLAGRNWQQTFIKKFRNNDVNDQIVIDTFFISSKFLWNQRDLAQIDALQQQEQLKYQKGNDDTQSNMIQEDHSLEFASQPRFEKLSHRKLTRLIANAMGMSIDQIVGCAVFLKGECDIVSKQLSSFYNYLFYEIMSIRKAEYKKLFRFFDLMSCTQFELVPYKVTLLGDEEFSKFKKIFLNPVDQQTIWIFHPDFTQDQKLKDFLHSNVPFINDPIANHYKADRCSFYGYIHSQQVGENIKIQEKIQFYDYLIQKFKCKMSIATLLLDLQNSCLQHKLDINQINLVPLNGVKIRQEAFLKFLYLQDFKRPKHMADAIMYFINQNPDEKQNNYNKEVIAEHLNYFINIENTVNEMEVEIPSQIPFYWQHLRFLFVNKILSTKIPVLDSSVQCWVKYGIKFLIDHKLLEKTQVSTTLSWVNLFVKLQMDHEIEPVRNIVQLYGSNYQSQFQIDNFIENQINKKFADNLFPFLQNQFQDRTLLKQTLKLIEGLAQVTNQSDSSLSWMGNRIKYFFTLDQDCFSDFAVETVQKLVNSPDSDYKSIRVFFSIFDLNPDYVVLNRFYGIKEGTLKIIKFLAEAMTYKDKNIIIDRWYKEQTLLNALQNQLSIHNVDLLFNQLRLLNSEITDIELIIKILRIDSNPNLAIIYMYVLSFHLRDYNQDQYRVKKEFEYNLAQMRSKLIKTIMPQIEPIQIEIMELFHWFANPDPLSFIIKLGYDSILSRVFLTLQMDKDDFVLFTGSVVSILKQDPQCNFSRLPINNIRNQSVLTDQLNEEKFLDMLGKSQSTLFRSALGLRKIFGIDPILTLGILNDNIDNEMMNTLYSSAELIGFEGLVDQISNQLSPLQIFQTIDQEYNQPQIGQVEIIVFPKSWNKNNGFSKMYPKSTIIFLLACKKIRNLLVYQKCKDKSQLYLVVSHYMDIILTYFDLFQQHRNYNFDKNILNHILSIGLCTSSKLYCKQQIVNFNFLCQDCLMLPKLKDLHQFGEIQKENDEYWVLFNDINSKIRQLNFKGIVDEQINLLLEQFLAFKKVNLVPKYFGVDELQLLYNQNEVQIQQLHLLKCIVNFPYDQFSLLITKYPNKTLLLLKQKILPQLVSEDQLDLLDNHTTQNYDKLITYFIQQVTDKPILEKKQININQQFNFLYDRNQEIKQIKKTNFPKESVGLIQFLDQLSNVAGDWHTGNRYNMIIVAFFEPQSFDVYGRDLDKIDDPEIVSTLLKLCLKYNLELNKLDFSCISQNYSYYQFDFSNDLNNKKKDENDNDKDNDKDLLLKKQSLKLNSGIDKILLKYSGLNEAERTGIKLLIRAFLGDIEAWYLLYQQVKQKYELFKKQENRFEKKNSNQFLLTFLLQLKQKQLRSRKYSRYAMENQSGLKIIMENQKDYIVHLLQYLTDTIATNVYTIQKQENILEFMKLVLLQQVQYINEKSMSILNISNKKLQVVTQLILFIIHNDQNSDTSKEFKKLEILIEEQKLFEGNQKYNWLILKFIYMIKQTDDLNILIEQIIILFQSQPQFKEYSKYLCLLISLSIWINIKYSQKVFSKIQEQDLTLTLKQVLGYPYQWIHNQELQGNPEEFIAILKLYNENVGDQDSALFSADQQIYQLLPDDQKNQFDYYFDLNQYSQASQQLIRVLHHKINTQGLGTDVLFNYKPIIDIIKQENKNISPQLDLFVEGMPKLFNENSSPEQKIIELAKQFSLFCNSKPLQELLTMQSKILINAPNKYDRMFEIFCSICNLENNYIKTKDIIALVHQIFQINQTLTELMHTEKNEFVIFIKIVEQLQTLNINGKPIFDKNILIVFKGIYALKYKQFDNISREFFQIMQTSSQNEIKKQLMMISQALSKPLSLINNQEGLFNDQNVVTKVQHLGNVSQKLISGKDIVFEDMFKLIDQSGTRYITGEQLHNFLIRTGIKISDHKMQEIIVKVMGDSIVDIKTVKIDFRRFQMAFEQIQEQTLSLALDYLGISKQLLIKAVITIVFYLLLLIIFILIGIQAFSIPGTFGSIINSLLPALGGVGLSKRSSNNKNKLIDLDRIEEIVRKSIEIIQTSRI